MFEQKYGKVCMKSLCTSMLSLVVCRWLSWGVSWCVKGWNLEAGQGEGHVRTAEVWQGGRNSSSTAGWAGQIRLLPRP